MTVIALAFSSLAHLSAIVPSLPAVPPALAAAQAAEQAASPLAQPALAALPIVPGGLTAEAVATRAAATSFEVQARAHERQAAEATLAQAKAAFIPQLTGLARYTRLSDINLPSLGNLVVAPGAGAGPIAPGTQLAAVPFTFPVILNQYTAQASLAVPLSDYLLRLPQAYASAHERRRAAELTLQATRATSALNGRLLFFGWARARWQVLVADQTLKQANGRLADAQRAAEVGSASRADVLRLQSQVAVAEALVTRSQALARALEQQLRVALHDERGGAYELGEDVQTEVDATSVTPLLKAGDPDALYQEALATRLEPKALEAATRSLREQAKAARAGGAPRLEAVGNAIYANPNQRFIPQQEKWNGTWDASIQISWTPTALFASENQNAALLRQAQANEAQRKALEDGIRVEVSQALATVAEAFGAQQSAAQGLAAAEEGYRVRKLLADNGRATTVELVDAEGDLLRARLNLIAARLDARASSARLAHALGRDIAPK